MFLKRVIKYIIFHFFYFFRDRRKDSVFFQSPNCKYSDNQRAVSEALYSIAPYIKQYWMCNDDSCPASFNRVKKTIDIIKAMAHSKVWVISLSYSWKPKDIFNIATWHGDRGFKKVVYDNDPNAKRDSKSINGMDLYLSGSRFGTSVARSAFRYSGEILELGSPRNDKLVHFKENPNDSNLLNDIISIKKKLGIVTDSKILLYAPTYRDDLKENQTLPFDYKKVLSYLEQDGHTWFFLVRAHSCSMGIDTITNNKIINVSEYPDMADLLLAADFLVTDYSSCCCDFVLTNRPCILLLFDENEFISNCRQYKASPKDAGFLIAKNEEEFYSYIKAVYTIDFSRIAQKVNSFYETNETGTSSIEVSKRIVEWINQSHVKQ